MSLSTKARIVCFGLAFQMFCGCYQRALADDGATGIESPATVAEFVSVFDLSELDRPRDAERSFRDHKMMFYETAMDVDSALVSVSDEFLKRGFAEEDSYRTLMATITVLHQGRPATVMLMNSLDEPLTHVWLHHHQGIDLSDFPKLQTAGPVDQRADEILYTSPIGVRQGESILRQQINNEQWELARTSSTSGIAKVFVKDGFTFVVHVEEMKSHEFEMKDVGSTQATRVHVSSQGNIDRANFPRPNNFTQVAQPYNSLFGVDKYFTTSKPTDAVKQAAKELQSVGWTQVDGIRESIYDRQRLLIRNGAMVKVGAKAYGSGRTLVDYTTSMRAFDLPANTDKRLIRIDTAASKMFFTTSADVQQVVDFYGEHLPAIGWEPVTEQVIDEPKHFRQFFQDKNSKSIVLNVQDKGPQTTWAELAPTDFSGFEDAEQATEALEMAAADVAEELKSGFESQGLPVSPEDLLALAESQLETALKDVPAGEAAEIRKMIKATLGDVIGDAEQENTEMLDDMAAQQPAKQTVPEGKLAADDFPIPEDAQNVTRDFEMVTFGVDQIAPNAKSINKELTAQGWKPRGEQMVETDFAYLKFQKGTGTINVSLVLDDRQSPPVHVVAQGDGLWFPNSDEYPDDAVGFKEADSVDNREMDGVDQADSFPADADSLADHGFDDSPSEFEGLRLPEGIDSPINSSSQFRTEMTTSIESDLKSMVAFFQTAAADANWKSTDEKVETEKATFTFSGDQGEMLVDLTQYEGEVEIHLALRNVELAKKQGFLPKPGLGKMMLANASESKVEIVINGKSYKLEPEQGGRDPKQAIQLNVRPGRYNYTIKGAGRQEQSDKMSIVVGGTWALIVFPEQGHMAEQMY